MTTATPLCESRHRSRVGAVTFSLLLASAASLPAHAGVFLGAGIGVAKQQLVCATGAPCDDEATGLRLFGGYRFDERFGAELGWLRAEPAFKASASVPGLSWYGRFEVEVISAMATWTIPVRSLELQLRGGIASVRGRFTSASVGVADSAQTEARAIFGASLRHAFADHWTVRADLDLTDAQVYTNNGRFSVLSLGIERRF